MPVEDADVFGASVAQHNMVDHARDTAHHAVHDLIV